MPRQSTKKAPKEPRRQPGPEPQRVVIEEPWEEAVDKALKKKRPADGWPRGPKPKRPAD